MKPVAKYLQEPIILALLIVSFFSLSLRIWLAMANLPTQYPDSGTYMEVAEFIAKNDFSTYNGIRTPGYPLLIWAVGQQPEAIFAVQSLLGMLTALLSVGIVWLLSRSAWLSGIAGLLVGLHPALWGYESAILTENLSAFLLMACFWLTLWLLRPEKFSPWAFGLLLLLASWMSLTRPNLIIVLPFLAALLWQGRKQWAATFLGVTLGSVVVWSGINYQLSGYPGPSAQTGISLFRHVSWHMEDAPAEYSDLKEVYLKDREVVLKRGGAQPDTIFEALPHMAVVRQTTVAQIAKTLTSLALNLIWQHPVYYVQTVVTAWFPFWLTGSLYLSNDAAPVLKDVYAALRTPFIRFDLVWSGIFLLLMAWYMLARKQLNRNGQRTYLLAWVIITSSVFQALLEVIENARLGAPFRPLIIVVTLCLAYYLLTSKRERPMPS